MFQSIGNVSSSIKVMLFLTALYIVLMHAPAVTQILDALKATTGQILMVLQGRRPV